MLLHEPVNTANLLASIGLITTLQKLLQLVLYPAPVECAEPSQIQPAVKQKSSKHQVEETLECIACFVPALIASSRAVSQLHDAVIRTSSSTKRTTNLSSSCTSQLCRDEKVPLVNRECNIISSNEVLLHQLQTNILFTLVRAYHICIIRNIWDHPVWVKKLIRACAQLPWESLKDLVNCVLGSGSVYAATEGSVYQLWEKYAVTHFQGRLSLGCCNHDCTNLEGPSEAALSTRLCSRCKRARYCSVKCQKAAWLTGGHKAVCRLLVQRLKPRQNRV